MEKYQPKKKKNPINLRSKLKLIILLCILLLSGRTVLSQAVWSLASDSIFIKYF